MKCKLCLVDLEPIPGIFNPDISNNLLASVGVGMDIRRKENPLILWRCPECFLTYCYTPKEKNQKER